MPENVIQQSREYMAKCAADSFMQSLMMRNPAITEKADLYLQKYMEVYNKSLELAERMQKQAEPKPFGLDEDVAALFK